MNSDPLRGPFGEDREHLDAVLDLLAQRRGPLLDVGSGDGTALTALTEGTGARGIALDRRLPAAWFGPSTFALVQGDAERLPFPDDTFAAVVSLDAWEWFDRASEALGEQARVSAGPCVLVQTDWSTVWFDSGDPETAREFSRLFAGSDADTMDARLAEHLAAACLLVEEDRRYTVRGDSMRPGGKAYALLAALREWLVLQAALVRARRFDEWRAELEEREAEGRFAMSLQRRVLVFRDA